MVVDVSAKHDMHTYIPQDHHDRFAASVLAKINASALDHENLYDMVREWDNESPPLEDAPSLFLPDSRCSEEMEAGGFSCRTMSKRQQRTAMRFLASRFCGSGSVWVFLCTQRCVRGLHGE